MDIPVIDAIVCHKNRKKTSAGSILRGSNLKKVSFLYKDRKRIQSFSNESTYSCFKNNSTKNKNECTIFTGMALKSFKIDAMF